MSLMWLETRRPLADMNGRATSGIMAITATTTNTTTSTTTINRHLHLIENNNSNSNNSNNSPSTRISINSKSNVNEQTSRIITTTLTRSTFRRKGGNAPLLLSQQRGQGNQKNSKMMLQSTFCYFFLLMMISNQNILQKINLFAQAAAIVSIERGLAPSELWMTIDDDDDNPQQPPSCTFAGTLRLHGGPFSLDQNDRFFAIGTRQHTAYSLVVDHVNRNQCGVQIQGQNYALQLITYDDQSDLKVAQRMAPYLVRARNTTTDSHNNNFDLLVGGYSSTLAEPLASAANQHGRLLLVPGAASTGVFRNRPGCFGTVPPVSNYLTYAMEGLAELTTAQSIATVWEDAAFTRGVCASAPGLAQQHGLTFRSGTEVPTSPMVQDLRPVVGALRESDPDIVITCVYDQGCVAWMQAMVEAGWSPRAQVFTVCVGLERFTQQMQQQQTQQEQSSNPNSNSNNNNKNANSNATYIFGVTPWDQGKVSQVPDAATNWTTSDFVEKFRAETGDSQVTFQAASAAGLLSTLIQALRATQSLNETVLQQYIASNAFDTVYGRLTFDENGQSLAPSLLIQYDIQGVVQTVYPEAQASGPLLYPLPTWPQRDCQQVGPCETIVGHNNNNNNNDAEATPTVAGVCNVTGHCECQANGDMNNNNHGGFVSVGVGATAQCVPEEEMNYISKPVLVIGRLMASLCLTWTLVCLGWVYWNRTNTLVRVSQPLFMVLLIAGCMISGLSIFFLGVETGYPDESSNIDVVNASCMTVPWLWGMGFCLTFSALFGKVWRVRILYRHTMAMRRAEVKIQAVMYPVLALMAMEMIILMTWQIVSPFEWDREVEREVNGFAIESVGQCTSEQGWWFLLGLVLFHVCCLIYALILCHQTKNLPDDFAESSQIFLAVMFMFQILVLAIPVSAMVRDDTDVFYFMRAAAIFLQNVTVLVIIFVPKMIRVYKGEDTLATVRSAIRQTTASSNNRSNHRFSRNLTPHQIQDMQEKLGSNNSSSQLFSKKASGADSANESSHFFRAAETSSLHMIMDEGEEPSQDMELRVEQQLIQKDLGPAGEGTVETVRLSLNEGDCTKVPNHDGENSAKRPPPSFGANEQVVSQRQIETIVFSTEEKGEACHDRPSQPENEDPTQPELQET